MQNLGGGGGEGGGGAPHLQAIIESELVLRNYEVWKYKYSMLLYHPNPELLVIVVNSWRFVKK